MQAGEATQPVSSQMPAAQGTEIFGVRVIE